MSTRAAGKGLLSGVALALVLACPELLPADAERDPDRTITVVALQAGRNHSKSGNPGPRANFDCLAAQAGAAAATSPDLIVFPEYTLIGWPYAAESVVRGLAEPIPGDGPWFRLYQSLAKEIGIPILAAVVESENGRIYNCAVLLNGEGEFVGKYRKVHANLGEQTWFGFSQGDSFQPIELDGVRYGFSICSDMWHPETIRCGELLGADVILHQSIADDMEHLVPARAFDSKLPIVMSIFQGGSYAVDASGKLLGKLPADEPGWKAFELRPFERHLGRKYGGVWDTKKGGWNVRNPAAYSVLLDPGTRPAWTSVFFDNEGRPQSRADLLKRFRGRYDANDPEREQTALVRFDAPWTSPFRVDPERPYQLINHEGEHLFILNKTAWGYFGCDDPEMVLDRARSQGVNVLRVALEGTPYEDHLDIEMWPWGGTRDEPDWSTFNDRYWQQVEERVRLAGQKGIGFDVVIYFTFRPGDDRIAQQRVYWQEILRRLGKYSNILTWEMANEYVRNEALQDAAGTFFKEHDPYHRPVCTSDGTTDDAVWPDKAWVDLAINHTCTSSSPRHDLRDWYLALARNTRSHGKPAFANETGREKRHGNDDGVHRRKQGWLWCAAGSFWTWHSWDGCEGINDPAYRAPGEEFLRPMAEVFRALPFWRMDPNFTACVAEDPELVQATLGTPDRDVVLAYVCARETGKEVPRAAARLRLPNGEYRITFLRPADAAQMGTQTHLSQGIGSTATVELPAFTDDLAIRVERTRAERRTSIRGTE